MARSARSRGRGRLSKIDLMPEECDEIIAWAARELADRSRTQVDIYQEFVSKLEALDAEHHGELQIEIPSYKGFNRYSTDLAQRIRRQERTREIVSALADRYNAKDADNLTIMAGEAIKTLVFELMGDADGRMAPKDAMMLAAALKSAVQAQGVSSQRRAKLEKEFAGKVDGALEAVAKQKGLTSETVADIRARVLGVET